MPSKTEMLKEEAKETPSMEKKESPKMQMMEKKMGVEKHPKLAKKFMKKSSMKK